jgi:hypothetical protein
MASFVLKQLYDLFACAGFGLEIHQRGGLRLVVKCYKIFFILI